MELANKIDRVEKSLGYRSRAEVVNDAIRRFLVTKEVEDLMASENSVRGT
jgi:metal-responsive CopG/Arc/MetJ family transcriptional regulator